MKKAINIALCCTLFGTGTAFCQDRPGAALPQGASYVALGSSFAAGPGIELQLGTCARSDHNYPHLVAAALNLVLIDVSCGGAMTAHILDTPQGDAAPQITAVGPDTALVTVTIGGNDILFTRSTVTCAGTAPEARCTAGLDQALIDDAVRQLPARLGAVLDAIEARAPQATVVLVTYPRVFPADAIRCAELAMSPDDTAYLAALGQKLQDAFLSAAAGRKTLIADAYAASEGHGPCAPTERWVNGAKVETSGSTFHPTAEGHAEMARLVLEALHTKMQKPGSI
jgi:lysophospholipase L1-like esterase